MMQLHFDQPPGQQLERPGRRPNPGSRTVTRHPSSGSCLATVRKAMAESAKSAMSSLTCMPAPYSMSACRASALT